MSMENAPTPSAGKRLPDGLPPSEQLLDLLLDALAKRQQAREQSAASRPALADDGQATMPAPSTPPLNRVQPEPAAAPAVPAMEPVTPPAPGEPGWVPPARVPTIGLGRTVWRTLLAILLLAVLFNIPINRYGVSLARILPDAEALVIRDGLLLKGSGPEVYVLQDNRLRWISSLEAFNRLGYKWDSVHVVDEAFLAQFEMGQPQYVLLKCDGSPHIYRMEGEHKRWIKDIATFEAEGHVWDDVRIVDCGYLDAIPDGLPIPEDAGAPPR
mgnify:CR=1 FL=1